jgi:ABC-type multidrug transport system fused ATPase/permease subunit
VSTPHAFVAASGAAEPHAHNGQRPESNTQQESRHESAEQRPSNGDAFRALLPKLLPLIKPFKRLQIEIVVYLILAAACNVATPLVVKYFLKDFQTFYKTMRRTSTDASFYFHSSVLRFVGILACIYMLNALVSLRRTDAVNRLSQNVLNALQLDLFTHLLRLPHSFYSRSKQGDLMTCLTGDVDNVQSALNQLTNKSLYQVFLLIGGGIGLILTTGFSLLTFLILLILPLFALAYVGLRTRNKNASREQRKVVGQTAAMAQEQLAAQDVIKAYSLEQRVSEAFNARIQAQRQSRLRLARLSALTDVSEDLATAFAQLLILGVGGYLALFRPGAGVHIEDLVASLLLIKYIIGPVASLSGVGQTIQQASGSMDRVCQLLDEPLTIAERPEAVELAPLSGEIRLDHVTFGYDEDTVILKDISLTIPAGAHVAIVGPTGIGKSTVLNLLMRFWDPVSGQVLFDGHDLRDVTVKSHRTQIGLVFQDAFIFDMTFRENIALSRPGASEEEVIEAARAAYLDEDIQNMPAGYDTVLGERGVRLSGGQRQRLAIARAILRDPAILLLDEATSALDAQTEAALMETIFHLKRGRTVVSVTHRLSWAKEADRIFVLNHAGIVEQGTHNELVTAGGLYQTLYQEQSGHLAVPAT